MATLGYAEPSHRSLRRALTFAMLGLLALLAIGILAQIMSMRERITRLAAFEQQQTAIARQSNALLQAMVDGETGMRGFAITGQLDHLETYDSGKRAAEQALAALEGLVPASSPLHADLERIRADQVEAASFVDATVALARKSRQQALAAIVTPDGKASMDALRESVRTLSDAALQQTIDANADVRQIRDSSTPLIFLLTALFLLSNAGCFYLLLRERRYLLTATRELDEARIRAEEADAAKTRFLALASHDMRQPLHAMTLYLAALKRRVTGDQPQQILTNMEVAAQSLTRMFSGLLDLARIESGVLHAKFGDVQLQHVFDSVTAELKDDAARTKTTFRVVPSNLTVRSDPELLESVLRNLCTNAIKYAPGGRVVIGARREGDKARIMVVDEGPGIPEDKLLFVFGEFVRLDAVKGKGVDGLGLGLSIAARVARLLGESLEVKSTPGRGTAFSLTAPIIQAAGAGDDGDDDAAARGDIVDLNIVVMDDDALALAAMKNVLADAGAHVSACDTAEKYVAEVLAGARHDLVILDPAMLAEASRLVKDIEGYKTPRLLIVTGATDAPALARLEASKLPWLIKPVKESQLLQAAARTAKRRKAAEPQQTN